MAFRDRGRGGACNARRLAQSRWEDGPQGGVVQGSAAGCRVKRVHSGGRFELAVDASAGGGGRAGGSFEVGPPYLTSALQPIISDPHQSTSQPETRQRSHFFVEEEEEGEEKALLVEVGENPRCHEIHIYAGVPPWGLFSFLGGTC